MIVEGVDERGRREGRDVYAGVPASGSGGGGMRRMISIAF